MGNSHLLSIAETWTKANLDTRDSVERALEFDHEICASLLMLKQWAEAERLLPKLGESRISPRTFRSASWLSLASADLSPSPTLKEHMPKGITARDNSHKPDIYTFLRRIPPVFADAINRDCTCVCSYSMPIPADCCEPILWLSRERKSESFQAMVRNMNRRGLLKKAYAKEIVRPAASPRHRYANQTHESSPEVFTPQATAKTRTTLHCTRSALTSSRLLDE
ncbi:hypothetical protein BJ742DRAFT_208024 [Cladochytrium replicatum]|nr:hypothetical protein BJ742DRAFT_208024 [Cladochytrium replicatum]